MANPGSPISYAMLSSYNTKLKSYNNDRFVNGVKYEEDLEKLNTEIDKKLNEADMETEPIDFSEF